MRQIKVRGWHTVLKKMFSPEEMGADQLTLMPDGRGFINVSGDSTRLSEFVTSMIPLQFTGLEDKNSKEIFDGDICQTRSFLVENGKQIRPKVNFQVEHTIESWYKVLCLNSANNLEVIGNIYENPDLLKDK